MNGARPLEVKEELEENLTFRKTPVGVKRSKTVVGKIKEGRLSSRRSSKIASARAASESLSVGRRILARLENSVKKEQEIVEQEGTVEEVAAEVVTDEAMLTEPEKEPESNCVAGEADNEVARWLERSDFEASPLQEDIGDNQPLHDDVMGSNQLDTNTSVDHHEMEEVSEDGRLVEFTSNTDLATLIENKKLALQRMSREEEEKREVLQGLEAERQVDQKRSTDLNSSNIELKKREEDLMKREEELRKAGEELRMQKENLATQVKANEEETVDLMKRQQEREVKISSINAELQEQQDFLLQEESNLKRCQSLMSSVVKAVRDLLQ